MMTEETKKKVILLIGIISPFVVSSMYPLVLLSRVNDSLLDFVNRLWVGFANVALAYFGLNFSLLTRRENRFLSNVYIKIVIASIHLLFLFVVMGQFSSFLEKNITIPSIGGVLSLFLGGYLAKIKGGHRKWLNDIEAFIAMIPPLAALSLFFILYKGTVLFWQFLGVR